MSLTESIKELRRYLRSVPEAHYDERHYKLMSELRIRKMLSQEKIKYPTKESFDERK